MLVAVLHIQRNLPLESAMIFPRAAGLWLLHLKQCLVLQGDHGVASPGNVLLAHFTLRAQLGGNITIKEMASACSLSESHFARGFRTSFGTSVHQYLIRLRIERAKTLLTDSKKQLAEIAQLSGFCDQAALTRTFSKVERMTPSRWRKCNSD